MENADTSTVLLNPDTAMPVTTQEVREEPAADADAQKPADAPAPAADDQNADDAVETPEQAAIKKESRRARQAARNAEEKGAMRREIEILREQLARNDTSRAPQDEEPKREAYDSDWAYLRAINQYDARKVAREETEVVRKETRGNSGQEAIAATWKAREATFAKSTPDYQEVTADFAQEEMPRLAYPARIGIAESEMGPALLYYLGQNPGEVDRLERLSPERQLAELGKLEGRLEKAPIKPSNAPAPIKPLNSGRSTSKDPAKMSVSEYAAHMKANGSRWVR